MSGCLITAMGLLQFGFLVDFISMPVISGFTTAAAITIASSQFPTILGIPGRTDSIIDSVFKVFENLSKVEPWDTTLGLSSVVLLVLLKVIIIISSLSASCVRHKNKNIYTYKQRQ